MGRISERFDRLLDVYRRPDGGRWGGQDLEAATGGAVTRSYVSTLKKGNIESPGFDKLRAIARAMGFPPELWFDDSLGTAPRKIEAVDEDATVAERLEYLVDTIVDEKKGRPYEDEPGRDYRGGGGRYPFRRDRVPDTRSGPRSV
jgi:transcriptional regulator with XRE-family HTH domain